MKSWDFKSYLMVKHTKSALPPGTIFLTRTPAVLLPRRPNPSPLFKSFWRQINSTSDHSELSWIFDQQKIVIQLNWWITSNLLKIKNLPLQKLVHKGSHLEITRKKNLYIQTFSPNLNLFHHAENSSVEYKWRIEQS